MNNLQIAYAQGFIKRAQEYNISQHVALQMLEKQALGWDTFQNVGEGITNAAKSVTGIPGRIGDAINRGGQALSGAVGRVGDSIQNRMTDFADNADRYAALPGRIGAALSEVAPGAVQGGQRMSDALHRVTGAVRGVGNQINTGVQQGAQNVAGFASNKANALQGMTDRANQYAEMPAQLGRQATQIGQNIQRAFDGSQQPQAAAPAAPQLLQNAGVNPNAFSGPASLNLGSQAGPGTAIKETPASSPMLNPMLRP